MGSAVVTLAIAIALTSTGELLAQGIAEIEEGSPVLPSPTEDDFLSTDPNAAPLDEEDLESDVGEIRILSRPAQTPSQHQPPRQPNAQLLLRSSAFSSSNVAGSTLSPASDAVFVNQATLLLTPELGPNTRLIATAHGGLTRFATEGENNYNAFGVSVGVQQRLTPKTYGQIDWLNNQLFDANDGSRELTDNSARLIIGRQDQLDNRLRLDTAYELQARFTNPSDRSRISNTLGTRLRYDFSPDWQATLGYRFSMDDYTQNGRFDTAHQLQVSTTYVPSKNTFVSGYASYRFGHSSDATVQPENLSFGIGVGINIPLF